MFNRHKNKNREPIRSSMQEWPNHDESWAEFMVRVDCESRTSPAVAIVLAVLVLSPCLGWLIVNSLDKAFG